MVDLDELERKAKAATLGPYSVTHENDTGPGDEGFWEWFAVAPKGFEYTNTIAKLDHGHSDHDQSKANAVYFADLDPATILELVRLARVGQTWESAYTDGKLGHEVLRLVCDPDLRTVEYGSYEWLEKISVILKRAAGLVVSRGSAEKPAPDGAAG